MTLGGRGVGVTVGSGVAVGGVSVMLASAGAGVVTPSALAAKFTVGEETGLGVLVDTGSCRQAVNNAPASRRDQTQCLNRGAANRSFNFVRMSFVAAKQPG